MPRSAYEIQMLHGMGEPIERALIGMGHRVRVYTPYGAMLPGMAYLVRRLLENTSNESFLKASTAGHASVGELLRDPEEVGAMFGKSRRAPSPATAGLPPFRNEPPTDFTRPEARLAMRKALDAVKRACDDGPILGPIVGGVALEGGNVVETRDPGDLGRVVSRVRHADLRGAEAAVEAARASWPSWAATPAEDRANVLVRAAELMRRDRHTLAAWEVHECGKPWREADGDVAEAIDFCEFYAREMIRLAGGERRDVPGETNAVEPVARGVVVVIPPWNFPMAIPMGMTAAALVAGNAVVLKPAEQSPMLGGISCIER